MELTATTVNVILIVGGILFGNYVTVTVLKTQIKVLISHLEKHDRQISELYDRTRYVMSGHQIRESIKEEVTKTHQDMKELQNMCTIIKDQLTVIQARSTGGIPLAKD